MVIASPSPSLLHSCLGLGSVPAKARKDSNRWKPSRCRIARQCWLHIQNFTGCNMACLNHCTDGLWLTQRWKSSLGDHFVRCLIATCAWKLWNNRCNLVFNHKKLSDIQIFQDALRISLEQKDRLKYNFREVIHQSNSIHYISVLTYASWIDGYSTCGLGFLIMAGHYKIILAGAAGSCKSSSLMAELAAIHLALEHCCQKMLLPRHLFTDCLPVIDLLLDVESCCAWINKDDFINTKTLISRFPDLEISYNPREQNSIADSLAIFGRQNPEVSLFHAGKDLPRWLEKELSVLGLSF